MEEKGRSQKLSLWALCCKGSSGKLQVCDIKRHEECHVDSRAKPDRAPRVGQSDHAQPPDVPTAAQIRLCVEVAQNTFGAQSTEFERKAQLAGRGDKANFPDTFNHRHVHARILRCLSEVLPWPKFSKRPRVWIGISTQVRR